MKQKELIQQLSYRTGIAQGHCDAVIRALVDVCRDACIEGDRVTVAGFISIEGWVRPEHRARHPLTNTVEVFPPVMAVKVKASDIFKKAVKEQGKV